MIKTITKQQGNEKKNYCQQLRDSLGAQHEQ